MEAPFYSQWTEVQGSPATLARYSGRASGKRQSVFLSHSDRFSSLPRTFFLVAHLSKGLVTWVKLALHLEIEILKDLELF